MSAEKSANTTAKNTKPVAKKKPKSPRTYAREFALQALYQWQLTSHYVSDIEKQFTTADGFGKADQPLFARILKGATEHADALGEALAPHLDRTWAEVSPIEKSILLIGAFELTHSIETPYRVIINEAIELAKAYGGTDGHKYVNTLPSCVMWK
jgi:transcription antitermination protein NusB